MSRSVHSFLGLILSPPFSPSIHSPTKLTACTCWSRPCTKNRRGGSGRPGFFHRRTRRKQSISVSDRSRLITIEGKTFFSFVGLHIAKKSHLEPVRLRIVAHERARADEALEQRSRRDSFGLGHGRGITSVGVDDAHLVFVQLSSSCVGSCSLFGCGQTRKRRLRSAHARCCARGEKRERKRGMLRNGFRSVRRRRRRGQ